MNNYYALIYLTKYLKFNSIGSRFQFSYSPHKDVWEGFFETKDKPFRLIFSANSTETALFADSFRNPKKANVTNFFETSKKNIIETVQLADGDRWITCTFSNGSEILFKLFGNNPNIFLIENDKIIESFKSPGHWEGRDKPRPREARPMPELDSSWAPKTVITKTDPKFPRPLISPLIRHHDLENKTPEEVRNLTLKLINQMKKEPEFRVLKNGNLCLINHEFLPLPDLKTFENCNDAIRYTYYKTSRERRLTNRIQSMEPRIENEINKTERTISQLEKADKALERAKTYETYGHLLMAHAHKSLEHDQESITVPNFYENNNPVEIPLKPTLSIAENAQNYYQRSSKAKTRVDESKRRLKALKEKLGELQQVRDSFQQLEKIYEFDDWLDQHKDQLYSLDVLSQNQKTEAQPFRKTSIEGYEIWIGKNAKSNDKLTSSAHKEDVWLHARGVSGSHVVIRMNNTKEYPPKHVILKSASVAAWNSKARGAGLAPVLYTKRKYISKPKGSPPGAVRVHQEEVEIVEPKKLAEWTKQR